MSFIIEGRVWVFTDNVDTDQILPGYAMAEDFSKLQKFAMAGSAIPDFAKIARQGDIVVAGKNFGCGSSREQAPVALKGAGVSLVIAESFARIFRRNAINIGLPVMIADVKSLLCSGDIVKADIERGTVVLPDHTIVAGLPLSANTLATIEAGGLINRVRQELRVGRE